MRSSRDTTEKREQPRAPSWHFRFGERSLEQHTHSRLMISERCLRNVTKGREVRDYKNSFIGCVRRNFGAFIAGDCARRPSPRLGRDGALRARRVLYALSDAWSDIADRARAVVAILAASGGARAATRVRTDLSRLGARRRRARRHGRL